MPSMFAPRRTFRVGLAALAAVLVASPCRAQWTRVAAIPATPIYSAWAVGDTIAAAADTAVYVSTDQGGHWRLTARPVPTVQAITAVRERNGRLYAGTYGEGVYVSDDLGTTWQAYNEGLAGGVLDSQFDIDDFAVRGDSVFVATAGAGVYVRRLSVAGTWHLFGTALEPNQASNVTSLAAGGARLLAMAGDNGMVFRNNPGETDWTVSNLDNVGIVAGLQPETAAWTGSGWVVGANLGIFTSTQGSEPWAQFDPGLGALSWVAFTLKDRHLYAAFDTPNAAVIEDSGNDGVTWHVDETLTSVFVEQLVNSGNSLFAARGDGLWRRTIGFASVPPHPGPAGARFALAGAQPFRDEERLRFTLPAAGAASIEVFDTQGRRVWSDAGRSWSAGAHEVVLDARPLGPGVYEALLTTATGRESLRLVHLP